MEFPLGPEGARPGQAARRLGLLSPAGSVEIDDERQGRWTTVQQLYSAQEVGLPPSFGRWSTDGAVTTARTGRRHPLSTVHRPPPSTIHPRSRCFPSGSTAVSVPCSM
ncbi:hypothetical protein ACFCYC_36575 [Streptomyces sp. NPDC056402]|uniref:hypothetical protein n=1 Tax=Streptomyces sp. NPDC056402 TaxID=3345810 RepID=UPI0035D86E99